jgi:hypothetical protein
MFNHVKVVSDNDELDANYKYFQQVILRLNFSGFLIQRGEKSRTRYTQTQVS